MRLGDAPRIVALELELGQKRLPTPTAARLRQSSFRGALPQSFLCDRPRGRVDLVMALGK